MCNSIGEYVLTSIILHYQHYQICIIFVSTKPKILIKEHSGLFEHVNFACDYLSNTIYFFFILIIIWSNTTKAYFINCFMFVTN